MTSENTRNETAAQRWLDRAANVLDTLGEDDLVPGEYVKAAAMIGFGYSQLAHLDDHRANRAEDLERLQRFRAEDLARIGEADQRVFEHYELIEERQRREIGLLDLQGSLSKALAKREGIELDEAAPKHAADDGIVRVIADENGPLHATTSPELADRWIADNRAMYGSLSVTALEVDRG